MTELTTEQARAEDDLVHDVHTVLERHFITMVDQGWDCGCGRTFRFSSDAVMHQVAEVVALIRSRLAGAGADALIDAGHEVQRLVEIGATPRDQLNERDLLWFADHPLREAVDETLPATLVSEALVGFAPWLLERAGDTGDEPEGGG